MSFRNINMGSNKALVNLPKNHPYRMVTVKPWAVAFKVPTHIVRIDIDKHGEAGTHGWQVRYRKKTKLFSDSNRKTRKQLIESLQDAVEYLDSIYKGRSVQLKTKPAARKNNEIMDVGIRLVKRVKKSKNITEISIEVGAIKRADSPKRFYVGTENTITPEKLQSKLVEARAHREQIVAKHKASLQ